MAGNYRHGYYGTRTYKSWSEMLSRCKNSNKNYLKGKGNAVCKEWKCFKSFLSDMGDRPTGKSLDRIDNYKGYSKENCRWATQKQQCRNKTNNLLIKGKTLTEWSEIIGISRSTLAQRYYCYKWSEEEVISTKLN